MAARAHKASRARSVFAAELVGVGFAVVGAKRGEHTKVLYKRSCCPVVREGIGHHQFVMLHKAMFYIADKAMSSDSAFQTLQTRTFP